MVERRPHSRYDRPRKRASSYFLCYFLCSFLGSLYIFAGKAWAEGKGEFAMRRHHADSGQENWAKCTPPWSIWVACEYE